MPPRAVLFDFDGVLADTENIHVAAWERTFAAMGWDVPPEVCARSAEEDDRTFLRSLFDEKQIQDGDVAGWVGRKQALTRAMLSDAPRLYPGVADLVARLAGKADLAVVSGTWRENAEIVLRAAGLAEKFRFVVGKEDVPRTKPDPAAYALAVARLGIEPKAAAALEDSPSGLASAFAAGLRCVAVGHRRALGDWIGGAKFVPDLTSTRDVMKALGFR